MPHTRVPTDGGREAPPPISIEVLGPLRLLVAGVPVDVPGPKRRAVLALLALAEGRAVTSHDLLDALWPSDPPQAARAALQSHISRLRGHLGPAAARLAAVEGGYRLQLWPGELDAQRVRGVVDEARRLGGREPGAAYERLRVARACWRGPTLADLAGVEPLAARAIALDDLRREVDDLFVETGLAAGEVSAVAPVAADALTREPLRERAVLLHMRALAGDGRVAEALRAGHDHRRRLREETGLSPSGALDALERELAGQSASAGTNRPAGGVPVPLTPLVGRQTEIAALQRLLAEDRLVTVVGPGGVGKTRVAIDLARRHDHATFLTLAPVTDPASLPHALAEALDIEAVVGDALATCLALLASGPRLLVIDNCEHLLGALRPLVTALLEACPQLTVLATSRERLGIPAERQVRLGPLAVADHRAPHPEQAPAVALFLERARRARHGFQPSEDDLAMIADLVRTLEGLPLSIELAAGRLSSLGLADLHARLDRALDLLDAGPAASTSRHHTLRSTIEWSYALLGEHEQRLFRHLAVFPDGVDLRTAEMVAADLGLPGDLTAALTHLVDASMLDADLAGTPRYRMLETVRSYALDRLAAAGEDTDAEDRLVRWAVGLAEWVDASLHTAAEAQINAELRRQLPNLRAAWVRARQHRSLDHAIAIAVGLDDAAQWRDLPELWHWADELADEPRLGAHPRAAEALAAGSDGAWLLGRLERAADLAERALAAAHDVAGQWRALLAAAVVELSRAEFRDAARHALASAALSPRPAHGTWIAALATAYAGELEAARQLAREHNVTSPTLRAEQAYVTGEIASIAGDVADAERHYQHAIDLSEEVGGTFVVGIATVGLLTLRAASGRHREALHGYLEVIDYWERAGNWIQLWTTLRNLATLLRTLADADTAAYLERAADEAPEASTVKAEVWRAVGPAAPPRPSGRSSSERDQRPRPTTPAQVLERARAAIAACSDRLDR